MKKSDLFTIVYQFSLILLFLASTQFVYSQNQVLDECLDEDINIHACDCIDLRPGFCTNGHNCNLKVGGVVCQYKTQLASEYRGIVLTTDLGGLVADVISEAEEYEFLFVNEVLGFSSAYTSVNEHLDFESFIDDLKSFTSYDVKVRISIGGYWCNYGKAYEIIIPELVVDNDVHAECYSGSFDENYIKTFMPRQPFTTSDNFDDKPVGEVNMTTQFFDGLGRLVQTVGNQLSPLGFDVVQHVEYDEFGRQKKQFLPHITCGNGGYKSNASQLQSEFYYTSDDIKSELIPTSQYPFAETEFDNSPLNRVIEQGAPGYDWQTRDNNGDLLPEDQRHTIKTEYATNSADDVINWGIYTVETDYEISVMQTGFYTENELFVTIVKDENWTAASDPEHTVQEFKDKQGNVILKRSFVYHDVDGNGTYQVTPVETYYVYDDFNLLRFVIPPEAVNQFTETHLSTDLADKYCYIYNYDERKRMISKKLPGADIVYMIYDRLDRLVLTQDGEMRFNNNWLFTKYDILNRPIATGKYYNAGIYSVVKNSVESFYNGGGSLFEERGSDTHGYTNNSFPTSGITEGDFLTVTYYDDYDWVDDAGLGAFFQGLVQPNVDQLSDNYDVFTDNFEQTKSTRGLVTGSKTKILWSSDWLYATSYYDKYNRVLQTVSENHTGGTDIFSSLYGFNGQVLVTVQESDHNFGTSNCTIGKRYEYDHTGRLLQTYMEVEGLGNANEGEVMLSELDYNEIGQVVRKQLHKEELDDEPFDDDAIQDIDYRYNIRGWLTDINNVDNKGDDLFAMRLGYNSTLYQGTPQYNGNISGAMWTSNDNSFDKHIYNYSYDALNRLRLAAYGSFSGEVLYMDAYSVAPIKYDLNGNILSLTRYSEGLAIDDLDYRYDGNKLLAVGDAVPSTPGMGDFIEYSNGSTMDEYEYDRNGNMTWDNNKVLHNIQYNYLNLPELIDFGSDRYIVYAYDAAGTKLSKDVISDGVSSITDYVGNLIYENGLLSMILTEEGRITVNTDNGEKLYEYFLKDHLGNTRATFCDADGDNFVDPATDELLQEDHYYPFGMRINGLGKDPSGIKNKYMYNGKELQDDQLAWAPLDWYDFGFRFYDPQLGRFTCLDPIAEDFHWVSPYNYAENSPIANIDLWGLQKYYAADGVLLGQVGVDDNARVVNSTLTNEQASTLIEGSRAPLIGSGDAQQQLMDQSTTVTDYADNVGDVLNDAPLETWANNGQNCNKAARKQMQNAGQSMEGPDKAIQTDVDNSKQPSNIQLTENTMGGAINIMTELKNGNPVMVGVKEISTSGNAVNVGNYNRNTGHFVVVSSMQKNGNNITFGYYDNANGQTGKSAGNRFNVNTTTGTMVDNTNVGVGGVQSYTISEVRKNKP